MKAHHIGLIGLDTSHVTAFARLLNDPSDQHYRPGAWVSCAWPGGSPDFELSAGRVAEFTMDLRKRRGVEILDSPEAVAEACDIIFITAVDGRTHPELLRRVVDAGKPMFIDKPFALSVAEAKGMIESAARKGVPLMSSSSLRYSEQLVGALASRERIESCDFFGPMPEQPILPGLFWYGCHMVEMLVAAMGPGCREVRCVRTEGHDAVTATWEDGRIGTLHGMRGGHARFGGVIHRKDGPVYVDASAGRPYYVGLLDAILASLPHGRSAVPAEEMLEVVSIIAAANESRAEGGKPITPE